MDREKIMNEWGYWRNEIANGHKGSAPRDWFESILDYYDEQCCCESCMHEYEYLLSISKEDKMSFKSFKQELSDLINRHSKESDSNTPDFILAGYMNDCLRAFVVATQQRETWYGRDARPSRIVGTVDN